MCFKTRKVSISIYGKGIYEPGAKECKVCNAEKYHILMEDYKQSLNFQSELLSKCRHKYKWTLVKLNSTTVVTLLLAESVCKKVSCVMQQLLNSTLNFDIPVY